MKKNLTKSKKREELLFLLDHLIEQYGNTMTLPLIPVDQQDSRALYTCCLNTCFLQSAICRLPRSLENPDGIQRALVTKKVTEIEQKLSEGNYGLPNAIVITLKCKENPYVKLVQPELSPELDGKMVKLTVALRRYREHLASCAIDGDGYLMEPEKEMLGYMIDGHHRTEGAYEAEQLDYSFATSIYLDLNQRKMAEAFAGINCYQEKPSAIHSMAMRYLSGLMTAEQNTAFTIMNDLNQNEGVFCQHIKTFDGPRGKNLPRAYVTASKMQALLEKWLQANVAEGFEYNTLAQQEEAILDYFSAWKACYPNAWDDSKFVLTKAMGIDILFDLYGPLCNFLRAKILKDNERPARQDFVTAIRKCFFENTLQDGIAVYIPKTVYLDEELGETLPLTWESGAFGALSSGKGINLLKKQLRKEIGRTSRRAYS